MPFQLESFKHALETSVPFISDYIDCETYGV
jgi:hypothetical protein